MGSSYIVPYHTKGKVSYGLGKTIITDFGVVAGDDHMTTILGWRTFNGQVISDYSRKDSWLLN